MEMLVCYLQASPAVIWPSLEGMHIEFYAKYIKQLLKLNSIFFLIKYAVLNPCKCLLKDLRTHSFSFSFFLFIQWMS